MKKKEWKSNSKKYNLRGTKERKKRKGKGVSKGSIEFSGKWRRVKKSPESPHATSIK